MQPALHKADNSLYLKLTAVLIALATGYGLSTVVQLDRLREC